jgi:predicted amidohydrolase YtcJ
MTSSLVLYNGRVYTHDSTVGRSSAISVWNNRIQAVGQDKDLLDTADPSARLIDLKGRFVVPGLTDSHFHFYDWALGLRRLQLEHVTSLHEMVRLVAAKATQTPPGVWILGTGWNETRWPDERYPTRGDLDTAASSNPVILWRNDLHLAVANSAALAAAHVGHDTPNPPEGIIDRDETGHPNGILRDFAVNLVADVIPPPTERAVTEAMRDAASRLHRIGITGIHDFRIMGGREGHLAFRSYERLDQRGDLPIRIWMQLPAEHLDEAIALGLRTGFGSDRLRVGHVKLFADGGQGARTAWMLAPYEDTGTCGLPLTPPDQIAEMLTRADSHGLAVAVHAIGDRANRELLTVLEHFAGQPTERSTTPPSAPHRIEHMQMLHPQDIKRLTGLRVVASLQPTQCTDDIPMIERSVGERSSRAYVLRDIADSGVIMAFGSDCPVADPNPFYGIHAAVTRQRRDGTPAGGWHPEQRLTVEQSLQAYTLGPAIATGRQSSLGSIAAGRLADLVVLDRDVLACDPAAIADTGVCMTVFDGKVVFQR